MEMEEKKNELTEPPCLCRSCPLISRTRCARSWSEI